MIVTRKSPFSLKTHSWYSPITPEQMEAWEKGMLVQDAFPHLDADQREFIVTGITPEEWLETFGEEN